MGLSHFWKTYTLYLFAICDTDLQSGCHIFGRLTGAEIWLGDQAEAKCRCGRKIKTQSDIFCKLHRQNRLQLCPTRKPNETSQELQRLHSNLTHYCLVIVISTHIILNKVKEMINEFSAMSDGNCIQQRPPTERKLRWMYGVGGS